MDDFGKPIYNDALFVCIIRIESIILKPIFMK